MAKDTRKDSYKPTRTSKGADIGGQGRDISKDIEKWSKVRGGKSGRC
jgi:hypothetical protein